MTPARSTSGAFPGTATTALAEAAQRWGTPLYVTDLEIAAQRLAAYRAAFGGALIAYAVKANPDPQLLRRLVSEGAGCEVVNVVELALARRAGCPAQRIVMNGIGKGDVEIAEALAAGVLVNAESLDELEAIVRLARTGARIGLRLNPGLDAQTHPHLATGAAEAKFGIALADLPHAIDRLARAGLAPEAIGAHIGSEVGNLEAYHSLLGALRQQPFRINLGGGLPAGADPADLRLGIDSSRLILEPGRSLVAGAGSLLTRVVRVQARATCTYLVADAGMTELIRPMLYGADHPVSLVEPGAPVPTDRPVHLAGPVCEAGDILARDLDRWLAPGELATAGGGAFLAIRQAGAYGAAMSSNYNGRLRPAEAVIEGGQLRLSRRRETLEDLVSRDA